MFTSLRSRLWLSYAFIIVTALSVVAAILFMYLLRNPLLYRQTIQRLQAVQTLVLEREKTAAGQDLSVVAVPASRTFNVRIIQYSSDKKILFDTHAGKGPDFPFPEDRLLPRSVPLARDTGGKAWLYSKANLSNNTYLIIAVPRPRISIVNIFTDDFLPIILQSGLIALLLSLAAAFFVARWIADPLQKVVVAARGDETKPVAAEGPHEVQELTRAFNSMIARAQAGRKSQRDFVANVSHELKTPLTSIQGFAQAILDGTTDTDASRQQAAQIIYDESARMHRMVLDLLDLAKLDAGTADITMSSVQIPALLNTVAEKFMPQSQKAGVQIKVEAEANLPKITADGDRLAQVFTNLVDNALKFTPNGGLITLRAKILASDSSLPDMPISGTHRVSERKDSRKEMLVSVADSGAGISPEEQAHIFDRFYQADPARKGGEKHGAGLGLAIAREIVQAHGGRIGVRSRLGEGTTFDVFLPLKKETSK